MSSSDKIGKLYRNQGSLFAIDDDDPADDANGSERGDGGDAAASRVECVNLNVWLEKPDTLSKFKCFYREKTRRKIQLVLAKLI